MSRESIYARWTPDQLATAGINPAKLDRLIAGMRRLATDMNRLGLTLYAADGTGYLIHRTRPEHDGEGNADFGAIVADVGSGFDGGGW